MVNRDHITDLDRIKSWDIVPGQALAVQLEWKSQKLAIIAVYSLNDNDQSTSLWDKISEWNNAHSDHLRQIDVLLGDMVFVEDGMGRAPVRFTGVDGAREAFRNMKDKLAMMDGWRKWNEGHLEWTWHKTLECSRIDWIYLSNTWIEDSRDWMTDQALVNSDHYLVICCRPDQ